MTPMAEWAAFFESDGTRTRPISNPPYALQPPYDSLLRSDFYQLEANMGLFAGLKLEEDELQVLWSPKDMETVKLQDDWTLAERTLMRGDIVVLGEDANGQMGTVTQVQSFVELGHVYGNDKPIYRCVPAALLYPSSEWRFELAVSRNGWIGSVFRFFWRLRLKLDTSDTILTVDTWSLSEPPIPLLRRESPILKDQPAEGRFFVGTTVAIPVRAPIENIEGDFNWIAAASTRTDFPDTMSNIPADERNTYVLGMIISSELSGVFVNWADHAQGENVGNTRPHIHQSVRDISVVDPYFYNSLGRYELTWATPEIREHYVDKDHFHFPDGTQLSRHHITDHADKILAKAQKAPQESSETDGMDKKPTEIPPADKNLIPSFQQLTEPAKTPLRTVRLSKSAIPTRFTEHPLKSSATTTGEHERVMADYEFLRRSSPLMAPHALQGESQGYTDDDLLCITSVTCFVDVQWQDGRTTRKHLSTDLVPYLFLGDSDFQPNDYVQSVPTTVEENEKSRLAVIQSVDHQNRVATVWWVQEDSIEPHVSIYMLEDADAKYHFRIGYFVLRTLLSHETRFEGTVGLVDNMDDRGRVYVLWVEGTSGWYYPCQLMPFDMGDYDLSSPEQIDSSSMQLLQGYLQDDEIQYVNRPFARPDEEDETEWESESMAGENTELSRELLYSYLSDDEDEEEETDEYGGYTNSSDEEDENEEEEEEENEDVSQEAEDDEDKNSEAYSQSGAEDGKFDIGDAMELYSDLPDGENVEDALLALSLKESLKTYKAEQKASADSKSKEPTTEEAAASESDEEEADPLAVFRTSEEVPKDHQYRKYSAPNSTSLPKLALKEWNLLQEATLDGAYVMAYEDRMDLFRFLIFGAHGTPFYLSWFMFDVQLDSDHPASPPRVHFHSLGPKLHPNLYEDGNVCLSLLGTWNGEGVEMWDPQHSNILQVVLSIQGLILGVKEPYYLEAGYDRHRGTAEGTANSLVYNERSFLLSVQQMKKLAEHPPPEFQELILASFRKNRHIILGLEAALSSDPEVLANLDMTMFGLPKGPPSLGFVSAFKSIFPSVKRVLEAL